MSKQSTALASTALSNLLDYAVKRENNSTTADAHLLIVFSTLMELCPGFSIDDPDKKKILDDVKVHKPLAIQLIQGDQRGKV